VSRSRKGEKMKFKDMDIEDIAWELYKAQRGESMNRDHWALARHCVWEARGIKDVIEEELEILKKKGVIN
jgi:hypothetical protein